MYFIILNYCEKSTAFSKIMILKMGVENRLKQSIPEIRDVVQV